MGPLKIALVHDFLFTYGGAERVLSCFHELYPEAPIYTLLAEPEIVEKHFPNATIITSPLQRSFLRKVPQLLLTNMPRAIESFDLNDFDVVLSSSGAFSHGVITGPNTVHICYCHSPMRYVWDWHREYLAEKGIHGGLPLMFSEHILSRLRLWDSLSANRVDHWLANSRTVAKRIHKFYRQDAEVIYPPVDTAYLLPSLERTSEHYAVTVSRLTKNKRIDLLIEACATCRIPLKVIGSGPELNRLKVLAKEKKANVVFYENASDEQKKSVVGLATCFLFAAEDDFGIAPVEALSMGVPVLALNRGGVTETVIHRQNGLLYNDATSSSLSEALTIFLAEGVALSSTKIRETALPFSREHFKQSIGQLIDHASTK